MRKRRIENGAKGGFLKLVNEIYSRSARHVHIKENDIWVQFIDELISFRPICGLTNDILYIQAAGSYSTVYTSKGERLVVSKNLKALEQLLDDTDFCRVHNSYLVNVRKVQTCNFQQHFCVMIDGS